MVTVGQDRVVYYYCDAPPLLGNADIFGFGYALYGMASCHGLPVLIGHSF